MLTDRLTWMLKTDGETLLSKTLYDAIIPGNRSISCQMTISYRIVAMLKKFRSLQGVPLMSTLGEESEEPSSPTKVNIFVSPIPRFPNTCFSSDPDSDSEWEHR